MKFHVTPSTMMARMDVGFVLFGREYAAGENGRRLDGRTVCILKVFQCDDANRSMRRLFHHNRGYAYARVV